MSKNLITKFRSFWRTLTPTEQKRMYQIMTALRGEDGGNERTKYRTTARIRGLLFGIRIKEKSRCTYGFFKPNPYDDQTNEHREIFSSSLRTNMHFRHHIRDALQALKPYVKKEKFRDLLRFM